ncbi:MAG: hypothetical protein AUG07_02905 [Acidobacteria bacterium 13_1_20CM_2_60_10]|nr:MAG: hypothetical protein AUG07_02905 [Acidobacteria bacterium 13_1_20CM_2_60_10]
MPCVQVGTAVRNGPLCSRVPSLRAVSFTLAVALAILASASAHAQSQAQHVYASGGTAVFGFAKDSTTGALTATSGSPYSQTLDGSALAVDPLGRFLYVLNPNANDVSVYAIDQTTGALSNVPNSPFTADDATTPQVLAAEANGKFLYVGNHQGSQSGFTTVGVIDIYSIDPNTGALTTATPTPTPGPFNPVSMVVDAKGRFLYVYQGPDGATGDAGGAIEAFQIDATTGLLSPSASSCFGGGFGLALAIDPKLRFLFAGRGDQQGYIDACTISPVDGSLQLIGTARFPDQNVLPDAMAVDSSGQFLYVVTSQRTMRAYSIDQSTGALTELPNSALSGITLGFSIVADPQGPFLYALGGNGIVGFLVDPMTGALTQIADGSTTGSAAVAISGTPVQAASGPVAALSPTSVDFGNVTIGSARAPLVVYVVNMGDQTLDFSSPAISITGANSLDFSQTNTCGVTLAPNQICTISVNFTPSATGTRSASLTISDNAPGSPQSVPLSGQGVTPQPAVNLVPSNLMFPNTLQGSSTDLKVAVTNSGQATLTISSVALSGSNPSDFSQTNDCTSLAPAASCTIHVAFTPQASGQRAASILITDNAAGSPHTVALLGVGDAPFTVVPNGLNPTSLTITAGQTAQYELQLTPAAGFTGAVTLACSGAPLEAACAASPSSAQVNNANPIPFSVSVATTARSFAVPFQLAPRRAPLEMIRWPLILFFGLVILFLRRMGAKTAARTTILTWSRVAAGFALLTIGGVCACGGGGSGIPVQSPPPVGTPAGKSTITVTATHGTITEQLQLTLIVK